MKTNIYKPLFTELLHGADYNYEQWLDYPEILNRDFDLMKEAGCNVMTIGVFSWVKLEPREGEYDFSWMDQLMDRLDQAGIKAILATPSGSKPAWLSHKYPEVCRVNSQGNREPHGYRHNHCRTSPIYRQKVLEINGRLAERYKNHPALLLWHVSNEYNAGECYCDLCVESFRNWLKERYQSLEKLNQAWWTTFWSHSYSDWSQIHPGDVSIHGLLLDWQRFTGDQTLDFYLTEIQPLKEITPHIPLTTNFMRPDVGLDYWQFAPHVSVVSWDSYPRWHVDKEEWREGIQTSFFHDLFRSMKNRPFMLMESSPNVTNWQGISIPKRRNMHQLSSLQAVAHGSDTVQYFQWRQSRGGEEKFHGAVVGHSGDSNTKVFRDVSQVGNALKELKELNNTESRASVAIIYDFQSEWALNLAQLPRNLEKRYQERCIGHYSPFWHMGVSVDIRDSISSELSSYSLVIAPMLYMLREGTAERLKEYVQEGGVLVLTYLSAMVNESDLVFLGGAPGPLRKMLGIWVEDTDILNDHHFQSIQFEDSGWKQKESYRCFHYADQIHLEGAKVLAKYTEGTLKGMPAITENNYGKGKVYYIASRNEDDFYTDFYTNLISRINGIEPQVKTIKNGFTIQRRFGTNFEYRFYMNFNGHPLDIDMGQEEILIGNNGEDPKNIEAYGLYITRKKLI